MTVSTVATPRPSMPPGMWGMSAHDLRWRDRVDDAESSWVPTPECSTLRGLTVVMARSEEQACGDEYDHEYECFAFLTARGPVVIHVCTEGCAADEIDIGFVGHPDAVRGYSRHSDALFMARFGHTVDAPRHARTPWEQQRDFIGPGLLRVMLRHVVAAFPTARRVSFRRITGARQREARGIPLPI